MALKLRYSDYVTLECDTSSIPYSLLVDTQADISILRHSKIDNDARIDRSDIIFIKGITSETLSTIGTCMVQIYFSETTIQHLFHIVSDHFDINADGIIGKDFLTKFNCHINFETMTITINNSDIPKILSINRNTNNEITIPARTETTEQFHIDSQVPCLVDNAEISPGVFIARTIVHPNLAYIRVINTCDTPQVISRQLSANEPLHNYSIYSIMDVTMNPEREHEVIRIITPTIPPQFRAILIPLIRQYADIFALTTDVMTTNNFYEQKLRIKDDSPTYIKNYRTPHSQKAEIHQQISNLLSNSLIEPSTSCYNSPIILVPKKSPTNIKKWRMCIDYRAVNKRLLSDRFPLPRIDSILDGLGRAQFFSVIDLYNGFHQVPLAEESRDITAFSADHGSYQWKVLPFGLSVSPNSFTRMMTLAFSGLPSDQAFIYMDDIIVIGKSIKNHVEHLTNTFQVCRQRNLKLNPGKSQFFRTEVLFLGHLCTNKGIFPDPSKYDQITNYPQPTDAEAVRRFTALANFYRKFVPNFALITIPLNALTKKKAIFNWSHECQTAFDQLKIILTSPQVLVYPDYNAEFEITVDASQLGVGAVLSQNDKPISFASKAFSRAERNKSTIEQELIAIHWAITHFKCYIYGTQFRVRTDHRPLVYLFNLKDPSSKLTRLRLDLEEYTFSIEHIPGKTNVVADALSRIHIKDIIESESVKAIRFMTTRSMVRAKLPIISDNSPSINDKIPKIYEATEHCVDKQVPLLKTYFSQQNDQCSITLRIKNKNIELHRSYAPFIIEDFLTETFNRLNIEANNSSISKFKIYRNDILLRKSGIPLFKETGSKILNNVSIAITQTPQPVSNREKQQELINLYHNNPVFGGHVGKKRLYYKLRQHYYWKKMMRDVATFANSCLKCQQNKVIRHVKLPMCITDTPGRPFEKISIDTVGPLPITENGNNYVLTINCNLTKYFIAVPMPNKEAKTIAKSIVENVFLIFGLSKFILTDMGTEYVNKVFKNITKLFDINHLTSTPYHPHTVGGIERSHRTLNEYLRSYLAPNTAEWDTYVKLFAYCYNTTPNSSFECKFSPFELIFGKYPPTMDFLNNQSTDPIYNFDDYAVNLKYKLQLSHKMAKELLTKLKLRNKINFDKNTHYIKFKINDKVLALGNNHKLHKVYEGPFTIIELTRFNAKIKNDATGQIKTLHQNRIIKQN